MSKDQSKRINNFLISIPPQVEREFFIDNLLVRIHFIIEMILVGRPCAMRI